MLDEEEAVAGHSRTMTTSETAAMQAAKAGALLLLEELIGREKTHALFKNGYTIVLSIEFPSLSTHAVCKTPNAGEEWVMFDTSLPPVALQ